MSCGRETLENKMVRKAVDLNIRDAISRIRFAPTTSHLLISSWDSALRLYDLDALNVTVETSLGSPLLDCCFLNESVALSAGMDCCIQRYDLSSGKQDTVGVHGDVVASIEYSEETGQLVSAGLDKKLLFWDIHAKNGTNGCLHMDSNVSSMCLCGYYIIVAVGTHAVLYDLRNLKGSLQTHGSSMDYNINCVRSLYREQGFAAGSIDGRVALKVFEAKGSPEIGCTFHCHPKSKDRRRHLVGINDIAAHPCCDTFVTGDDEGYAIVWDGQSKKRIFEFPKHADSITSVSYDHNGQKLAIAYGRTYQDMNEMEQAPQIFVHEVDSRGKPFPW